MTGPVLLAFGIWMLFTADFSWLNVAVGLAASFAVSLLNLHRFSAWQLVRLIGTALLHLPVAVWESLCIVLLPHRHERMALRTVRDPGNPWAVFCQTFVITFTPRTLVCSEEEDGQLQLHSIEREDVQ